MISGGLAGFAGKHVLLLQGPLGPFFRRLGDDLRTAGARVTKINFNGGDWLFYPGQAVIYRRRLDEWPAFFQRFLAEQKVDVVMLFGDCRPIHRKAHEIALAHGVEICVFEEGYVRPDYVTLERLGVNGHSQVPRAPMFYRCIPAYRAQDPLPVGNSFWHAAAWATLYYSASILGRPIFRHYLHHRPLGAREVLPWLRALWRKPLYAHRERGMQQRLETELSEKFFLVPLQVHCDAQVRVHSGYRSVEDFIRQTLRSFAAHAPADTHLVIKHHPMDRGYTDYGNSIALQARKLGVSNRVHYIHDQHLPTLLQHARGVVVINSTVGMSALHHRTPVKVTGSAIYDIRGLTYAGTLDNFWQAAAHTTVDHELYRRFHAYLVEHTQINGNFYKALAIPGSRAGLAWETLPEQPAARPQEAGPAWALAQGLQPVPVATDPWSLGTTARLLAPVHSARYRESANQPLPRWHTLHPAGGQVHEA